MDELRNIELETSVMGCVLFDDEAGQKSMLARLKEHHLTDPFLRSMLAASLRILASGRTVDIVLLGAEGLDQLRVMEIQSSVATATRFEDWLEELDGLALRRIAVKKAAEVADAARNTAMDSKALKKAISEALASVGNFGFRKAISTKAKLAQVVESVRSKGNLGKSVPYCVGWADKAMTHYRAQIHTLGAFQGEGKTAAALTIANAQIDAGLKVCYVCTESKGVELLARMLGQRSGIAASRILEGCGGDEKALNAALRESAKLAANVESFGIYGLGEFDRTIEGVADISRRFAFDAGGIDMLILDFLQDLRGCESSGGRKGDDGIYERVSHSVEGFKSLVEEMDCAGLMLSQFNRDTHKQAKPTKASFRGSGVIDDASHIMSVLWREGSDADRIAKGEEVWPTWWYSVKTRLVRPFSRQIGFKSSNQQYVSLADGHRYAKDDLPERSPYND